jgi:cobalt-zinc-cadmium efflux system membrane fusion protein
MNQRSEFTRKRPWGCWTSFLILLVAGISVSGCTKPSESAEPKGAGGHAEHEHTANDEAHHDEVKLTGKAIVRYGIKVEPVRRQILTTTILAPARVSFNTEAMAHVGAVLHGRVVQLKVKKGDAVKRGEELLIIESPELGEAQSDFLQKQTAVKLAEPAIEIAQSSYERAKKLYEGSKGITLTDLQKREAEHKAAQGTMLSAQSAAMAAENKLRLLGMSREAIEALSTSKEIQPRYAITAPIDALVTEREVTLGEFVNPEKEALLVLADMRTLWVLADVPEVRIAEIAAGSPARVTVAAAGVAPLEGKVSLIDPSLDPTTRSARVRIEVENNAGIIRPGMFAHAEISVSTRQPKEPVLAIPDAAVQMVEGRPAVFVPVKDEDNTFEKRAVTVGKAVGGLVPVESGLEEGDQIVTSGSFILKAELGKGEAEHEH